MAIDYSTDIGRVRLRVADISDLPYLPDQVYSQYIADANGNLPQAAKNIACVILGLLSFKDHRKLAQIEVFGNSFKQYKEFLLLTTRDPNFMQISPIAYGPGTTVHPLIQFQQDWNRNYVINGSQTIAFEADISPNDGSRTGILGNGIDGNSLLENIL
jgi:hypothetical protein